MWPLVMAAAAQRQPRVADLSRWLFVAAVVVTVVVACSTTPARSAPPEVTPDGRTGTSATAISKADTLYLGTISRSGGLLLGAAFAMIWRPVAVMRGRCATRARCSTCVALVGFVALA